MSSVYRIAIAGAGIGGLSAAALLARQGHRVTVFDQFEHAGPVGSGLVLQETGLRVLAELGLRNRAEELGAALHRLYGISADTRRTVLDVRYRALRKGLKGVAIQRPVLFDLVYSAALESGAAIVPGTRITGANGQKACFISAAGERLDGYDVLVDAMGVRSPLTSQHQQPLPYAALWATLPWPVGGGFDPAALEQRYLSARKMVGVMPSGRSVEDGVETVTYFWSIRADTYEDWRATPLSHWKDEARGLWPETAPLLDQIRRHDDLTFATYTHRTFWPAVQGRLVHLGDSWHAASPQLGQGGNMALLDAYALARACARRSDPGAALTDYVRMRALHVRVFQAMSYLFTPVYQSDSRILPWLRDWLAAPVSRIWPAPQILAAMVSGAIGAPLHRLGLHRRVR